MKTDEFAGKSFTAPEARARLFTEVVLRHVRPDQSLRVLDIGCGGGAALFELAKALPRAQLEGVDVSELNIRMAEATCRQLALDQRLRFVVADYMSFRAAPFDLVVSDSTLQHIAEADKRLFSKLVDDLAPRGLLIFSIPHACAYNSMLWGIRRLFRLLRSPFTDRLILAAGRLLERGRYSEQLLRERVPYMYLLPERRGGRRLNRYLQESFPFDFVAEHPVPHVSLAQPKHRVSIFRKR